MNELEGWTVRSHNQHLVSHVKHKELDGDSTLHVVVPIFNPVRYNTPYRLARECIAALKRTPNVVVHIVEIAFGDRQHEIADPTNPNDLLLRTSHEMWHKERQINLSVKHTFPRDWKYMAWVDSDVFWENNNWALEAIHQLQHHPVIQPWMTCADLGHHGQILQVFKSFCYQHVRGVKKQTHPSQPYEYAHSGFAWACTRAFYEAAHGLMDFPILGSADHHMAFAMINEARYTIHGGVSETFHRRVFEWEKRAFRFTKGNLGFVKVNIQHGYHGPKHKRRYRERWEIFVDNKFCPDADLMCDEQGLYTIVNKPKLESDIRAYMRFRDEDSFEDQT